MWCKLLNQIKKERAWGKEWGGGLKNDNSEDTMQSGRNLQDGFFLQVAQSN